MEPQRAFRSAPFPPYRKEVGMWKGLAAATAAAHRQNKWYVPSFVEAGCKDTLLKNITLTVGKFNGIILFSSCKHTKLFSWHLWYVVSFAASCVWFQGTCSLRRECVIGLRHCLILRSFQSLVWGYENNVASRQKSVMRWIWNRPLRGHTLIAPDKRAAAQSGERYIERPPRCAVKFPRSTNAAHRGMGEHG